MEQDTGIDSEMILRDLENTLYEYEQEIMDDVAQEFETLRSKSHRPEEMPLEADKIEQSLVGKIRHKKRRIRQAIYHVIARYFPIDKSVQ